MPRKPKRPCRHPNCPNLTDGLYCNEHQKDKPKEKSYYDPTRQARYNGKWQVIRKKYISQHPFCERCNKKGILTIAEHVHHILPLADGGSNEENNLMSLCISCHSKTHYEMGNEFRGHRHKEEYKY